MNNKKLGLWMLTALVAGNMIGSGVFLLPANLAQIGSISILAWISTAVGAFFLALVFAKMSLMVPKTGGPYAYAKAGFGRFIGFQTAYNYWIAVWVGNAAIAIATIGYLAVFWPVLNTPEMTCLFAIIIVWILTLINIVGVRSAGVVQLITTILKMVPIVLVIIFGWWYFHPAYLSHSFNISHSSNMTAFSSAAALTLWAFIGLESATVPAGSVDNPSRNIPLATLLGTLIAAVVYIASCTAIMGMIPAHILAKSVFPFAAAANIIFGAWGKWLVAAGAVIACFGALNGWTLLQGQVPMAAADDNLFPKIFSKRNKAGTPVMSIVITSVLVTILLLLTVSPSLVHQFKIIILMAVLATVVPYLFTTVASIIVLKKQKNMKKLASMVIAVIACIYAFWITFSSGEKTIFYGLGMIFLSIPLYALVPQKKDKEGEEL